MRRLGYVFVLFIVTTCSIDETKTLVLKSGKVYDQILIDRSKSGFLITSSGPGKAIVGSVLITDARDVVLKNIHVRGNGRHNNSISGIHIERSNHITIDSIEVEGFQKSGVSVDNSNDVAISNVHAFDNGFAGISALGVERLSIRSSLAENNPGDPTNKINHSGNGIIVGYGKKVLIEHCRATNNGWDMPRVGNGPVGIWAWESDSVLIQYCTSYRNRTSKGGDDGGGFDLDGGVTNSVIQYCLSYENEGSAVGLFQYSGAKQWKNNIVRNNISWNDGKVSPAHAGIYVWNASGEAGQLTGCEVTGNIIYNDTGAAISFAKDSNHENFLFSGNLFLTSRIYSGIIGGDTFENNTWRLVKAEFMPNFAGFR